MSTGQPRRANRTPEEMAAEDCISQSLDRLHGLASCLIVLGRADRTSEVRDELIDDALPMLGEVMMDIAGQARDAQQKLEESRWAGHQGGAQ